MQVARFIARRRALFALALVFSACGALPQVASALRVHGDSLTSGIVTRGSSDVQTQEDPQAVGHASATLEDCAAAGTQASGSATFSARMTALPGSSEMELRFEVLEREQGEASYHRPASVGDSAVGAWRISGEHVTVFKDFDEVTGLAGPGLVRARIHFRWLDSEGHVVAWAERRTEPCKVPLLVAPSSLGRAR
jgi:hypothetical protein